MLKEQFKVVRNTQYDSNFDLIGFMYKEIVEDDTYGLRKLQKKYGNSIKTILDIGGNLGVFSVYARELFPEARIISLEAFGDTWFLLKENTEKYNIEVYHMALGNGENLYLNLCPEHSGANSFKKSGSQYCMKSKKLIDIFKELNIEPPYVIKLDIEGGEMFLYEDKSSIDILKNCLYFTMEYHNVDMLGYRVDKQKWDEWLKNIFDKFTIDGLDGNATGATYTVEANSIENKDVYNEIYTKNKAYNHNVMYKYVEVQKFANTIKGKILDAGCGEGWTAKKLRSEGFDLFGIEISDICCNKFLQDLPHECTDIISYAKKDIKYDGLICFDVLEHISYMQIEETIKSLSLMAPKALLGIANHSDIQFGYELHLIQQNEKYWEKLLSKYYSSIKYIGCLGGNFYLFECEI